MTLTTRDALHELVDQLEEEEWLPVLRFMEYLRDRGSDTLVQAIESVPENDDLITEEDLQAMEA